MFFIAYCRTFFLPPSEYGIGSPNPIRDLFTEVFNSSTDLGGRNRVVLVDSGFSGGDIEELIALLADPLRDAGADVRIVSDEDEIFDICPSSLTGLSRCFGADRHVRNQYLDSTLTIDYVADLVWGMNLKRLEHVFTRGEGPDYIEKWLQTLSSL